jgi:DHA2 family multidrug resistance protein
VTTTRSEASHRGLITLSIMLATIMQALDTTIANVALPHMQGSVAATQDQISWVLTSYIVAAAIMTPPTGFLAARLGRRRLFLWSIAGFTVVSMLCGIATSLGELVLFRLLQGVFGAALVPLSQSVLLDTYPREQHGSAMALWGVGVMVGPILGPTLGGWLTEYYSWRWVFYINLPFGLLAFFGVMAFVRETERVRRPFDLFGFLLLSIAIGSLQLMLDRGQQQDWLQSAEIWTELAICGLCFYMFVVHMATAEHPFLPPRLFLDRNFVVGLVLIFIVGIILLATMALLPPFLQNLKGYPVLTTGYVLAPRGVGTMISMFLVGRLIRRIEPRVLILAGMALTSFSLWDMAQFTTDVPASALVRTGIVQGLGLGLIFVPLSTLTFATLAPEHRTDATGLFSLLRNLGSSIGISIVMTLLAQYTQINHASLAEFVSPLNPLMQAPWLPDMWRPDTPAGMAMLNAEVTRQAEAIAYLADFKLMMFVVMLAVPLLLLLRKARPRPRAA